MPSKRTLGNGFCAVGNDEVSVGGIGQDVIRKQRAAGAYAVAFGFKDYLRENIVGKVKLSVGDIGKTLLKIRTALFDLTDYRRNGIGFLTVFEKFGVFAAVNVGIKIHIVFSRNGTRRSVAFIVASV